MGDKTPLTLCEVRVSPHNTVTPNIGSLELAEALSRVLPFTAKEDDRPVLNCVLFTAKEGKLTMVSADGFRLAVVSLDYDGEGEVLINRGELAGIANALRRARRARVSFEGEDIKTLTLDTELIRYKWVSTTGKFPDWEKLIPTEASTTAHFDTVEAIRAVNTLKTLSDNPKAYPIDLVIGDGKIVMANPDNKGDAIVSADTDGNDFVRVDGGYLAQALKACGGMTDFQMTSPFEPMLFSTDGYQLVVMPMITDKATERMKAKKAEQAKAPTEPAEPVAEHKPKRSRTKQPVTA